MSYERDCFNLQGQVVCQYGVSVSVLGLHPQQAGQFTCFEPCFCGMALYRVY